jgi:hypothetical protein
LCYIADYGFKGGAADDIVQPVAFALDQLLADGTAPGR